MFIPKISNILSKAGIGFGKPVVLVTQNKLSKKQVEPPKEVKTVKTTTTYTSTSNTDDVDAAILATLVGEFIGSTSHTIDRPYSSGGGGDFVGGGANGSWESDSSSDSSSSE